MSERFAVTVAFSAPVRGFDLTDLEITNGSAEGMLSTAGQRVFTVQVAPQPDAGGSLTITVPAGAATDAAGNPTTAAGMLTLAIAAGPANGALAVAGAIPDQPLEEGGAPVTLDLAPFFTAAAGAAARCGRRPGGGRADSRSAAAGRGGVAVRGPVQWGPGPVAPGYGHPAGVRRRRPGGRRPAVDDLGAGRHPDVPGRVLPSSSVGEESLSPNHPDTSSRF